MPKIPHDDKERNLSEDIQSHLSNITITTKPVFIAGVNRKANVGNFETVDVYAGVALPLDVDPSNTEELTKAIEEAASLGFAMVSKEAGDRYGLIKGSLK